jgi:hypothetical protein
MPTPLITIGCVSNLWSRMMHFKNVGDTEIGHKHQFDHLTLLAKGSLKVTIEGKDTIFKAPHMIFIQKDKFHELVAIEEDTVAYCIHALRNQDGSGDILDPAMIPEGSDAVAMAAPISAV